ncbi:MULTISPECIES: hypothetical protein [Burkholderia cepacia complex]|uniref:hypothetical protein n=1 Tax=Burkholderia cepacia complex TaxID=87882 RepID=UPI001453EE7F|nr:MULTISPECIES: hypothetical protein [Burkholderia cepacia complex]MBJ9926603.1 hypothetical protein [Burkholderia cenocepacia]MCA8433857.1 hypothetical protein [Burkholderia seminalis]MDN7733254.1 hypothetical protein [Burkholderia orbicola]VWB52689.1 hypothetical protein BSE24067_02423 [Burkholderia seminalis]
MASNNNLKARVACLEQRRDTSDPPIIIRRIIASEDESYFDGVTVNGAYVPCAPGQSASELEQQLIAEIKRQRVAGRFLVRKERAGAVTNAGRHAES